MIPTTEDLSGERGLIAEEVVEIDERVIITSCLKIRERC